jgi:hypothetical protein
MKKYMIYIIIIAIAFAGIILSQNNEKKEVDWNPSFSKKDKIPYGTRIFYDLVNTKYSNSKISIINDPGELVNANYGYTKSGNLIIVQDYLTDQRTDFKSILSFAEKGNNVFLAANELSQNLRDTLKLKISDINLFTNPHDSKGITLTNPNLKTDSAWHFNKNLVGNYFTKLDSSNTMILGKTTDGQPDFVRIKWGEGNIYYSCIPYMFTNISMLRQNNIEYAEKCLAYIPPAESIYWYEYSGGRMKNAGLLDYVFSQPPLKYAYLLLISGLFLYVLFEGKRRQKIIPVIPPLKNSTKEFAETIGRLYFQEADHKNIAEKKISYFYEFLRNRLYFKNIQADDNFYLKLSSKTGIDTDELRKLFKFIEAIKSNPGITENDLIKLNTRIDNFYKHF